MLKMLLKIQVIILFAIILIESGCRPSGSDPCRVISELNIGEVQNVRLTNGDAVNLSLIEIKEIRDSVRNAIREASVKVSVDGEEITLSAANYNLPVIVGNVQIDCPAIKDYLSNSNEDDWKLVKDARFRLWPKSSSYLREGTFIYPIKQEWLASMSQTANEPTYVDGGENPAEKAIY